MISTGQALDMNIRESKKMPHVPDLEALYAHGWQPRKGELMMVAGRPGAQKSGFVMWLVEQWGLPTLYFSGDMSAHTASARIASMKAGMTTEEVEKAMLATKGYGRQDVLEAVESSCINFAFGEISYGRIEAQIDAWVEVHNAYPEVLVIDNLCDIPGCEADYAAQMEAMQGLAAIKTELGINVIVLHHASDKSWNADAAWKPPSRQEVKGGLAEKPECSLTVAYNPNLRQYNIAVVKQRSGFSDPAATSYVTIACHPEYTRFSALPVDGGVTPIKERGTK